MEVLMLLEGTLMASSSPSAGLMIRGLVLVGEGFRAVGYIISMGSSL
jgi:hypothetical protein